MLLNYRIYNKTLNHIDFKSKHVISTINAHSYCLAVDDNEFKNALENSDILLPDGIGIVWAIKFLYSKSIKKIAGYDLFMHVIKKINDENGSIFFLGASEETLKKIKHKLTKNYPKIKVEYFSPPFKEKFSNEDSLDMCKKVNEFKPDVLFVGMTAPKQEKWVNKHKDKLNANNICCIGAVFDFYSEKIKRPSEFWVNNGLEWFPRFLNEPKRLFKRNFISTPKFILETLSFKLFGKGFL